MLFPWTKGEPNLMDIPTPVQAQLFLITLLWMDGDALLIRIPPPSPKPGVSKPERPFCRVKPLSTELNPSCVTKVATESCDPPSMIVTAGPCRLATVIARSEEHT